MKIKILILSLLFAASLGAQTSSETKKFLTPFEGYKHVPYQDNGGRTVGIGHKLGAGSIFRVYYSNQEINDLFNSDYNHAIKVAKGSIQNFSSLPTQVKLVCISLIWTCGKTGFLKFTKFRTAISDRNFHLAASELSNSLWATQVSKTRLDNHLQILNSIR